MEAKKWWEGEKREEGRNEGEGRKTEMNERNKG